MIGWPAPQAGLMPPPSFQWLLTCFSAHSGSVLQVGYRVRLRLDKEAFGMRDWVKHGETIHQFLTFCPPFCPTGRPVIQVEPPRSESDDAEWLRVDVCGVCIYTRNAWVLPRRCSVYMSHSRTNDVANYRNSYGKNNTGTRDYQTNKVKTPEIPMGKTKTAKYLQFLWKKQQRY